MSICCYTGIIIPHVIIIIMIMSEQSVPSLVALIIIIIFTSVWECNGMIVAGMKASLG